MSDSAEKSVFQCINTQPRFLVGSSFVLLPASAWESLRLASDSGEDVSWVTAKKAEVWEKTQSIHPGLIEPCKSHKCEFILIRSITSTVAHSALLDAYPWWTKTTIKQQTQEAKTTLALTCGLMAQITPTKVYLVDPTTVLDGISGRRRMDFVLFGVYVTKAQEGSKWENAVQIQTSWCPSVQCVNLL